MYVGLLIHSTYAALLRVQPSLPAVLQTFARQVMSELPHVKQPPERLSLSFHFTDRTHPCCFAERFSTHLIWPLSLSVCVCVCVCSFFCFRVELHSWSSVALMQLPDRHGWNLQFKQYYLSPQSDIPVQTPRGASDTSYPRWNVSSAEGETSPCSPCLSRLQGPANNEGLCDNWDVLSS